MDRADGAAFLERYERKKHVFCYCVFGMLPIKIASGNKTHFLRNSENVQIYNYNASSSNRRNERRTRNDWLKNSFRVFTAEWVPRRRQPPPRKARRRYCWRWYVARMLDGVQYTDKLNNVYKVVNDQPMVWGHPLDWQPSAKYLSLGELLKDGQVKPLTDKLRKR